MSGEAVAEWERTGWRTFHWEPWFAGLADGARASVLADAVTWATPLWSSFEWTAPSPRSPRSAVWTTSGAVRRRARSDSRAAASFGWPLPGDRAGAGRRRPAPSNRWRWSRWPAVVRAARGPRSWLFWLWPPDCALLPDPCLPGSSVCGRTVAPTAPSISPPISCWPRSTWWWTRWTPWSEPGCRIRAGRAGLDSATAEPVAGPAHHRRSPGRQKRALAALASGFPAAVSGISSTTSN